MTGCLNCLYKHLAQAQIIHEEECTNGYPRHIHRVIGHLAEASREIVAHNADLAMELRSQRIRVMDDPRYMPPYDELLEYVEVLIAADRAGLPTPATPIEVRAHPEEHEDDRIAMPAYPMLKGTRVNVDIEPTPPPYKLGINPSDSPFPLPIQPPK